MTGSGKIKAEKISPCRFFYEVLRIVRGMDTEIEYMAHPKRVGFIFAINHIDVISRIEQNVKSMM